MATLEIQLADKAGLRWAQEQVTQHHYLHHPVDARCSVLGYVVMLAGERVGCLMFGRPESTRCYPWYGSVADVAAGRCRLSRWEIINLARVWLSPDIQQGGKWYVPNAATQVIAEALHCVVFDYLMAYPPCFVEEPYELRECLSYCSPGIHRGTLYRAASFRLERTNDAGLQTYARSLRGLQPHERRQILRQAELSPRSRHYRALRAAEQYQQPMLMGVM